MRMNSHLLIKSRFNWADEFDIDGYSILRNDVFESSKLIIDEFFSKCNCLYLCFGTNEDIEFMNAAEIINKLNITPLTQTEASIIGREVGFHFGLVNFNDIMENINMELQQMEEDEKDD